MEQPEKKTKRRGRGVIVLLVILLILAAGAGYVYYSVFKVPFEADAPRALAASEPMSAEERFTVSASDGTVQVRMDKKDLWHMILTHAGKDFMDVVNGEASAYGLHISGCAIRVDEEGLWLDLELMYQEVRLVAKVSCGLEVEGTRFSLKPSAVKLGVIKIPVEGLLSSLKLEYEHVLPVLTEVTRISYEPGAVVLTGPMEQDVRTLLPAGVELDRVAVFAGDYQPLADALREEGGFEKILAYLEQHPACMEDLYRELFTLTEEENTDDYLEVRYGLTERFFPGIDFSAVKQQQEELVGELRVQYITLEKFFTNAANEYNEKRLSIRDGVFIYEKEPFQAALFEYRNYGSIFEVLDPDSTFLIVVDAEDGFIRKTSSFYRMVDENQQFTREVDLNKTYILGFVFRSVDGQPYLLYEKEVTQGNIYIRQIQLQALTEAETAALQEPGKIGVWTNRT